VAGVAPELARFACALAAQSMDCSHPEETINRLPLVNESLSAGDRRETVPSDDTVSAVCPRWIADSVYDLHAGHGLTRSAETHIGQRWVSHSLDQMVLPACAHSVEHESNRRRTCVSANVRGRDVVTFVAEAQKAVENKVVIPAG